jgi:N-methylhydantoinase A
MSYSVCIDIGGTFTDCLVAEHGKGLRIFKSPSTPGEFERGFMNVLELAADHYGANLKGFLAACDRIVHGTTVATNALVEGKVAPVGFVCNMGHPDILLYREAPRKRCFEFQLDYPEPLVPRVRTHEVDGRIDFQGREIVPLSEDDARGAVDRFRKMEVEAIAVCLLWSNVNGDHEVRVRDIIRESWADIPITLSHELNPIPREYRRAASAVIDASLYPIVSSYVSSLLDALAAEGFAAERFLLANCTGGMMPPDAIIKKPIYSVMSGPTLAPIAAQSLTRDPEVVVVDMGGTTFDVSAIRDDQLIVTPEAMVGDDMLGIPKVDVRSVGAGGGSIAWVDVGGLIQVGPQSAGARPGPACYGLGGVEATVTDANVVLGLIDPDYFLGGRFKLDREPSSRAIEPVAEKLGIGVMETAYTIYTTCNHNMITAIEDMTVKDGINPRDSHLIAGGGCTGCHIAAIATELGMKRFMVPKFAAGLSAYGGLISDIRWEESATLQTIGNDFALDRVNAVLKTLRERGLAFLEHSRIPPERRRVEYVFAGRYEFQSWEIDVPFTVVDGALTETDIAGLVADFHQVHERIYTIKDEHDPVEFVVWKVRAIGEVGRDGETDEAPRPNHIGSPEPKAHRPVFVYEQGGLIDLPIYSGNGLGAGAAIEGPAVIEEETTTIFLMPNMVATTDMHGNYTVVV